MNIKFEHLYTQFCATTYEPIPDSESVKVLKEAYFASLEDAVSSIEEGCQHYDISEVEKYERRLSILRSPAMGDASVVAQSSDEE